MAKDGTKRGRPPGAPNKATVEAKATKEAMRELLRQKVSDAFTPLVDAQIANAQGIKYLVARDKVGKFSRISEDELKAILAGEDNERVLIEVWDKDPSVQAFTDLMNRAIDKPIEPVEMAVSGDINILTERLAAGRKRIAADQG